MIRHIFRTFFVIILPLLVSAAPEADLLTNRIVEFKNKAGSSTKLETWVELSENVQDLQDGAANLVEQRLAIVLRSILLQELAQWQNVEKNAKQASNHRSVFDQILQNLDWTPSLQKALSKQTQQVLGQLKETLGSDKKSQIGSLSARIRVEPEPLGAWGRILRFVGIQTEVSATPVLDAALGDGFQYAYFESYVNRYLDFAIESFNKSPYQSLEKSLTPVLTEQIRQLKSEVGNSGWYLLESLAQFNFEQPEGIFTPLTLRSVDEMNSLQAQMAKTKVPLERVFGLVVLYQVARSWTEKDVQLLKADLSEIKRLRGALAQRDNSPSIKNSIKKQ